MHQLSENVLRRSFGLNLSRGVASDSVATFGLQLTGTVAAFVTSVFLARAMSTEEYGLYLYAINLVALLTTFAMFGLDKLSVREVARYKAEETWGFMRGFLTWSTWFVAVAGMTLAIVAGALLGPMAGGSLNLTDNSVVILSLVMLPVMAVLGLLQANMRGLGKVVQGQIPLFLLHPLMFIGLLVAAYFFYPPGLTARTSVLIKSVAAFLALALGLWFFLRSIPFVVQRAKGQRRTPLWIRATLPFLVIAAMQVLNARVSTLYLGTVAGTAEVSLFGVASRAAEFIVFPLTIINIVIAPRLASLYVAGEQQRLRRLLTQSARSTCVLALPVALIMLVFGYWVLAIFGSDYTVALPVLRILSVGQLVNLAAGSAALLLNMTGHERVVVWTLVASTALLLVTNVVLVPPLGALGAAWATMISLVFWNVVLVAWTLRRLEINTTVFARLRS
jgi:O-antigen/teichoic acid export membrane protein